MELSERQERILKAIVEQYVTGAHPVGSAAIVSTSGLSVSSATVRNDMSVLEELGYIRQLHTSGGRVPTGAGYRYYVERLMEPVHLSNSEARTIRHQFHQSPPELQEWLKLAATIIAHRTHNVGLITAPKATELHVRHLEVIAIQHTVTLVIVVLTGGTVLQEMLTLAEPHAQEELSVLADRLSATLRGMTPSQVSGHVAARDSLEGVVLAGVSHLLHRAEEQHAQIFHAGLTDLLQQPEFLQPRNGEPVSVQNERLRHMVEFLHHGFALQQLLAGLGSPAHVQIVIGGDTPNKGLEDYSFVLGRYGDEDDSMGFLGVVGPTRLEYPRAVALVRYMTDLMSDLMQAY